MRLLSLDAFRGLTIAGMLLVNNIALDSRTPAQLTHAPWNGGVRFADVIFPWFLLIVGVAISYSAASARKKEIPWWRVDLKILSRVLALVFLGCVIDSSLAKRPVFDLNVLQLIGLAYGTAALLYALPLGRRLAVAAGLLALHGAAIQFLPVPGIGAGIFREDANLIQHLTRMYLSPLHLDGLLSVVPTTALVLIGSAFGDLLQWEIQPLPKVPFLLLASAALILLGWAWHFSLPYNKPVWTASYILLTAGLGGIVLTALYALVDIAGIKWPPLRWVVFPLTIYGSNAIAAYVGPILIKVLILREWTWRMPNGIRETLEQTWLHAAVAHYGPYWGGWVYTLAYLGIVWLVLLELYRRKIFLRV